LKGEVQAPPRQARLPCTRLLRRHRQRQHSLPPPDSGAPRCGSLRATRAPAPPRPPRRVVGIAGRARCASRPAIEQPSAGHVPPVLPVAELPSSSPSRFSLGACRRRRSRTRRRAAREAVAVVGALLDAWRAALHSTVCPCHRPAASPHVTWAGGRVGGTGHAVAVGSRAVLPSAPARPGVALAGTSGPSSSVDDLSDSRES